MDSPEITLLKAHLETVAFQSGIADGSWGIIQDERLTKSFVLIWILAKTGDKYFFRFDLNGYNEQAPTAILWNNEGNIPLEQSQWPLFNKRAKQVFKKWRDCLYIPCDRIALNAHAQWPSQYPNLRWKPFEDSIIKYVDELYHILNH